jgi:hypothetical protein
MFEVLHTVAVAVANLFNSRRRLEAENILLRHQLNVAFRQAPARLRMRGIGRAILAWTFWVWRNLLGTIQLVKPETVLRWHRAGFRASAGNPEGEQGGPGLTGACEISSSG